MQLFIKPEGVFGGWRLQVPERNAGSHCRNTPDSADRSVGCYIGGKDVADTSVRINFIEGKNVFENP